MAGNRNDYISQWRGENIHRIELKIRKDSGLKDAIDHGSDKAGASRNQYILDAIRDRLDRDGIAIVPMADNTDH